MPVDGRDCGGSSVFFESVEVRGTSMGNRVCIAVYEVGMLKGRGFVHTLSCQGLLIYVTPLCVCLYASLGLRSSSLTHIIFKSAPRNIIANIRAYVLLWG